MTLLAKSASEARKNSLPKNTVVEVVDYEINPKGGLADQVLIGIDISTGETIRVVMGQAISETAEQERCTIPHLAASPDHKVSPGGFVRLDKVTKEGDLYKAAFVKKLNGGPDDQLRTFVKAKARVFKPRTREIEAYGQKKNISKGRIQLMNEEKAVSVSSAEEFEAAVINFLTSTDKAGLTGLGRKKVFLRDGPVTPAYTIGARTIEENGNYRPPSAKELRDQLKSNTLFQQIKTALEASGGKYPIELIPGEEHIVLGKSVNSREYLNAAGIFWHGEFSVVDPDTGELKSRATAGFREGIIGLKRQSAEPSAPWFVVSVSATFMDRLTLNGLEDSQALMQNDQEAAQEAPVRPVAEQQGQQRVESPAPTQQQLPAQNTPVGNADLSLDELLDAHQDDDEVINAAAEEFLRNTSSMDMG